jgi:DNA repair protein RecO (recombination protein O)
MEYRYNAIVLKKREVGETDRLYIFYTQEAGKLRAVAKGVRKAQAKLAASLETGMAVTITVMRTRGTGKITGAVAERESNVFRDDYEVYAKFLFVLDRLERLVEFDEKDERLYALLAEYLSVGEALLRSGKREQFFFLSECFLIQIYAELGYEIDTSACQVTGEKLVSGRPCFFSPAQGGIIQSDEAQARHNAFLVSEEVIKIIRATLANPLPTLLKLSVDTAHREELKRIGEQFYAWIIRH